MSKAVHDFESAKARQKELKAIRRASMINSSMFCKHVRVPHDPNNTILCIREDDDPQEAIEKFKNGRKQAFIDQRLPGLETASISLKPETENGAMSIKKLRKKYNLTITK